MQHPSPDVAKLGAGCGQEDHVLSHTLAVLSQSSRETPAVSAAAAAAAAGICLAACGGCNGTHGAGELSDTDQGVPSSVHTGRPHSSPGISEACSLLLSLKELPSVVGHEVQRESADSGTSLFSASVRTSISPAIDNRHQSSASFSQVEKPFSTDGSSSPDLACSPLSSRPVRIRKPPRTFISEMEDLDSGAGASKRRKRGKQAESGDGDAASAACAGQANSSPLAQVVLEASLDRNAEQKDSAPMETFSKLQRRSYLDEPRPLPEDPMGELPALVATSTGNSGDSADGQLVQGGESHMDLGDLQLRGRLTRSMLSKATPDASCSGTGETTSESNAAAAEIQTDDAVDDDDVITASAGHTPTSSQPPDTPKRHSAEKRLYKRKWRNQYGSSSDVVADDDAKPSSASPAVVGSGVARSEAGATSTAAQETSTPMPTAADVRLDVGDFVWGKMRGFDWWPGFIVSAARANQASTTPGHVWVCWFGDNQFSQILLVRLRSLIEFRQYLICRKPKALYRRAIMECGESVALRVNKQFPFEWPGNDGNDDDVSPSDLHLLENFCDTPRQRHLLRWALGGFAPEGLDGLRPSDLDVSNASWSSSGRPVPESPLGPLSPPLSASPPGSSPLPMVPRGSMGTAANASVPAAAIRSPTNSVMVSPRQPQQMVQSDARGSSGQQLDRFAHLRQAKLALRDCCLCCGTSGATVRREHPLFVGGICDACIPSFIECAYCFDEDGSQTYCCICADGKEVYLCDSPGCARSYCPLCIEKLCGADIHRHINKLDSWMCFMCDAQASGLLAVRDDWHARLLTLMASENSGLFMREVPPPPPPSEERQAIRVLGLFDGIGTGMLVLNELGIEVAAYVGSEIDADAVRVSRRHHTSILHVGAVEEVTSQRLEEWGPFDLVIGGSPCNDLSMANPARRGIFEGSGRLFFDYYRLLQLARPAPSDPRPFFWLFENVVSMRAVDKATISRFLECNPSVVDARDVSPAHRPRYFWGNLPGMARGIVPWPGDVLSLQECVEPNCGRRAKFEKLRTITTKTNSIRQTKQNLFPVSVERRALDGALEGEDGDMLWCTEMERIFGFPTHYTDVGNMGRVARQRLLGRAWSTPVVRHLLAPLRDYFKTTGAQAKQLPGVSPQK